MFCRSCGSKMEDSFNVCQNCGTKKGVGMAFCESCGSVRQAGLAFCQDCGAKFDDQAAQQQAPAQNVPYAQQTPYQQMTNASQGNAQYLPPKKFCRNCGTQVMNNQAVCTNCGVKVGTGFSYCPHCAAPVTNPQQVVCTSCGMSLKSSFDAGSFVSKTIENLTGIFKLKPIDLILDYGASFLSFILFIFSFIPTIYVYAGSAYYGIGVSEHYNAFKISAFAGLLLILAFLFSVARFIPPIFELGEKNKDLGSCVVFVTPALSVISAVILIIKVIAGFGYAKSATFSYGITASCGFTFLGVVFLILVFVSAVSAVLSFLKNKGIIKF